MICARFVRNSIARLSPGSPAKRRPGVRMRRVPDGIGNAGYIVTRLPVNAFYPASSTELQLSSRRSRRTAATKCPFNKTGLTFSRERNFRYLFSRIPNLLRPCDPFSFFFLGLLFFPVDDRAFRQTTQIGRNEMMNMGNILKSQ